MNAAKRFVIVTGLAGAGKSQALRFFEDLGYYCVDNLPAQLLETFADLVIQGKGPHRRVAVCVDARSGRELENLPRHLDAITEMGLRPETLFLDSGEQVLVRRYSETRRPHPLAEGGSVEEGIRRDRKRLMPVRGRADLVIDTSETSLSELRARIGDTFGGDATERTMHVTIMSFGFKHGLPQEADNVVDVRFLPNPHYVDALRPHTGNDPEVRDYVLNNEHAAAFLKGYTELLRLLLPQYEAEPKAYLTLAVGCTGGRHRSVAIANALAEFIQQFPYTVRVRHRDASRSG